MHSLFLQIFIVLNCFFADFPQELSEALRFFKEHDEVQQVLTSYLSEEEKDIALAIVAPEIGICSTLKNGVEYGTMLLFYILYEAADFSIGCFQMKPSFAELIERQIVENKELKNTFPMLLIKKQTERECRKTRIDRLMQPMWQARYLAAFISICKQKTFSFSLNTIDDKIKYWATLYNSGVDLPETQVLKMQGRYLFPRFYGGYNYGEAALDFYKHMKEINH